MLCAPRSVGSAGTLAKAEYDKRNELEWRARNRRKARYDVDEATKIERDWDSKVRKANGILRKKLDGDTVSKTNIRGATTNIRWPDIALREPLTNVDALHFLRLGKAYTDDDRSTEYTSTAMLAANPTPRDRSELLMTTTRMVQVDQDNALALLSHSIGVNQHFVDVCRAQSADAPGTQQ